MGLFLDRIDAAPLANSDFKPDFNTWVSVMIDSTNETTRIVQAALLSVNPFTELTQAGKIDSIYIPLNATLPVPAIPILITMPQEAPAGARITIAGYSATNWKLIMNAGQTVHIAGTPAATSIASSNRYDSISIICVVENTEWTTLGYVSSGLIIV